MNEVIPLFTGSLISAERPGGRDVPFPVYAWLIVTADKRTILVDSGNPADLIGRETSQPWWHVPVRMSKADALDARLRETGREPRDIDYLIATHLDFDHCGNMNLFDGSGKRCIVQSDVMSEARTGDRYERQLWDRPGLHYDEIEGDREIEPGVTLLKTSGHAHGHMSLLVETEDGPLVLAVDALSSRIALGDGPYPDYYIEDEPEWLASRTRLVDLATSMNAPLIFGHDVEQTRFIARTAAPIRLTPELRQSGRPVLNAT